MSAPASTRVRPSSAPVGAPPSAPGRVRLTAVALAAAFLVGGLTQPFTWKRLADLGIGRPDVLVDFLDTSGAYAAIAFVGGAMAVRMRWSLLGGSALQAAAFLGYYAAWHWTPGTAPGAVSWGVVALLTAPVAGWLGHLWRHGRRWLVAAPLGLIVSDSVTRLVSVSHGADPASRFAGPVGGLVVVAVALAVVADGTIRARLRLVLLVVVMAAVAFCAFALVLFPGLDLLFSDCGDAPCPPGSVTWPVWPETGR